MDPVGVPAMMCNSASLMAFTELIGKPNGVEP